MLVNAILASFLFNFCTFSQASEAFTLKFNIFLTPKLKRPQFLLRIQTIFTFEMQKFTLHL